MFKVRLFALAVIIIAFALAAVASFLPLPQQITPEEASTLRSTISFLTFLQVITLGITGLFLIGLKGFKTAFKRSYYFICLGQIIGVATAVAVYSGVYISSYTYPEVEVVATIIGFVIAIISASFIFTGIRYFAHLLRVQASALSPYVVLPLLIIVMAGVWLFSPYIPIAVSELLFHLQIMLMAAYSLLTLLLGIAILQVRQITGVRYRRPLAWFAAYLLFTGSAVAISILSEFIGLNPLFQQGIFLLYIISTMTLVCAGLSFNKITRQREISQFNNSSAIDLLTYMASYASSPQDIDVILDEMRAVTAAKSKDNAAYSSRDIHKLINVYRGLENYLITKEPLRIFTKDSLRAMLSERFDISLVAMLTEEPHNLSNGTPKTQINHSTE